MRIYGDRIEAYAQCLPKNGLGAELGVWKAENAVHLLAAAKPEKLYLVEHDIKPEAAAFAAANPRCELIAADDCEWLDSLPAGYLDWCYLDTTHYLEQTRRELPAMRRAIRPGGVLACHDFDVNPDPGFWGPGTVAAFLEAINAGWIRPFALTNEHFASLFCEVL